MPATPDDLFRFLDELGVAHATVNHPPLHTVAQSQALRGGIPGGHSKNLFLKDKKGALFLIVAEEDALLPLNSLHPGLGCARLSFGAAERLRAALGVEPGSVTPFAVINDTAGAVTVVLEAALMRHDMLNFHPLTNTMTTSLARADLIRFLDATGHSPRILPLRTEPGAS